MGRSASKLSSTRSAMVSSTPPFPFFFFTACPHCLPTASRLSLFVLCFVSFFRSTTTIGTSPPAILDSLPERRRPRMYPVRKCPDVAWRFFLAWRTSASGPALPIARHYEYPAVRNREAWRARSKSDPSIRGLSLALSFAQNLLDIAYR